MGSISPSERALESFLVANRRLGTVRGAFSIAASWLWAPSLFLASQVAFERGLPGLVWFLVPNFLSLVAFSYVAKRLRHLLPEGYTLPQLMRLRYGKAVHRLYLIQFLGMQVCAFAVQIVAGAWLLHSMFALPYASTAFLLGFTTLAYSLLGGLRASVFTDLIQMLLILVGCAFLIPLVVEAGGGWHAVERGIELSSGPRSTWHQGVFDPDMLCVFGVPLAIALLTGPLGDQMQWQRAYAFSSSRSMQKGFLLGACIFIVIPIALSLLGFLAAADPSLAEVARSNAQMVGPTTVHSYASPFLSAIYVLVLIAGLCSTLDSCLCAVASLWSIDVQPQVGISRKVPLARASMVGTACLGIGLAMIPGLQILHLVLFYGSWRAATVVPTLATLFSRRVSKRVIITSIMLSLCLGAPLLVAGTLLDFPMLSLVGSVCALTIGLLPFARISLKSLKALSSMKPVAARESARS